MIFIFQILRLDRNNINSVPSLSLNGPQALREISLRENRIGKYFLLHYLCFSGGLWSVVSK